MRKIRVIANLVVYGSLCLIAWSGITLYRKARTLELIADTRAIASERVNRALTKIEINWGGDQVEPAPSGHGLSANQATFLLCIGVLGILWAAPRLGKLADIEQSEANTDGTQPNKTLDATAKRPVVSSESPTPPHHL